MSSSRILSQDSHRLRFSDESRKIWTPDEKIHIGLKEEFQSCRCLTTLLGERSGNSSECVSNVREVSDHAKECHRGHSSFRGLGDDKKWDGTCIFKPERKWDQQANRMIDVCAQTGHSAFPFISVLS